MEHSILIRRLAFLTILGSATLLAPVPARAQSRDDLASKSAEKQAFTTLKNRLYACILAIQPRANISNDAGPKFRASYYDIKYPTHLWDHNGKLSEEPAASFPAGYDEFSLNLSPSFDATHYRTPTAPQGVQGEQREPFGTTYNIRYNLGPVDDVWEGEYPDVPIGDISFKHLRVLGDAGLSELPTGTYAGGPWMTRYEFAVEVARAADRLQSENGKQVYEKASIADAYARAKARYKPEVAAAFLALAAEFSSELTKLGVRANAVGLLKPLVEGQPWRPRYKYLDVEFSYGRGLDDKVVAEMKRAIADYAAQFQTPPAEINP